MAIKLKVQTNSNLHLKTSAATGASFTVSQGIPIYPNAYTGATEVTPSADTQTLATEGLMMTANITINPIPSNYGLVTWDGATLTVS